VFINNHVHHASRIARASNAVNRGGD
jgi:hypothetical protein